MCLALPARVLQLDGDGHALVDAGGVRQRISVELLDQVAVDDWILIHVGYALTRLDPDAARSTLALTARLHHPSTGGPS